MIRSITLVERFSNLATTSTRYFFRNRTSLGRNLFKVLAGAFDSIEASGANAAFHCLFVTRTEMSEAVLQTSSCAATTTHHGEEFHRTLVFLSFVRLAAKLDQISHRGIGFGGAE